ncbi:MAG: hypothetical protein WBE76_15345 [Terracidiphilus sp.]
MPRSLLTLCALLATAGYGAAQANVRIEPSHLEGPRALQQQTADAAIRDYLEAWQSMGVALGQNRAASLDADFVGTARTELAGTIQEQAALGIRTRYQDRSHDIQIVFYSPEGLSIELTDTVEYDVQIFDHDKPQAAQRVRARYLAILTPSEVSWRVRVLQANPE